ncbi:TPA: hypothetical protein EYO12_02580 [Candidatus Saccharibacteria bacterium]|nr:hypothetical protein [Candidatus Saccharibacteria bacterium]HIO88075.1 hypothetical protein [Candidatus Saccharibacteria bacterium]
MFNRVSRYVFIALLVALNSINSVLAQAPSSNSYNLGEFFIGPAGTSDANSSGYNLQGNLGDIGAGESSSASYNLLAGFTTDAEPTLLFTVNGGEVGLGLIDTSTTGTGTATFSVGAYNADGVVVQTLSQPPSNGPATLDPMTSTGPSSTGTEQFGMNLVANTSPTTFGADPTQVPDASFSFATVAAGYGTANQFRYNVGETIAESTESTGQTDFTISYIANAGPLTEGGEFSMDHILVATATY